MRCRWGLKIPSLNFTVFIDKILSGDKTQTIRTPRKHPIKPGDKLYLYTGMRQKNCRPLGEAVCSIIEEINIVSYGKTYGGTYCGVLEERHSLFKYPDEYALLVAKADGFDSINDFFEFFIKTYKMKTQEYKEFDIIKWKQFKPAGDV